MRLTLNIEKRHAYLFVGILIILTGILIVTAFNTNNPAVFGHSPGEIGPGTFLGDWYVFNGSIGVSGESVTIGGNSPGVGGNLILKGSTANPNQNIILQNYQGDLYFGDSNSAFASFKHEAGAVRLNAKKITAEEITLGGVPRTSWPSGGSTLTMALCSSGPSYPISVPNSGPSGYGPDGVTCTDTPPGGGVWIVTNGPNLPKPITTEPKTIYMGKNHKFCFLNGVQITGTSNWRNPSCGIGVNPDGTWYLQAGYSGDGAICGARCVD